MITNIFITGVGGQGLITLKKILSHAAINDGQFFRSAEIRGLAQRGGEVNVHFRVGDIQSPLISQKDADLILSLDMLEATRGIEYASGKTTYLVSDHFTPFFQLPKFDKNDLLKVIGGLTKNIFIVDSVKICTEKLGSAVYESSYLLGFAFAKNLLPFKEESLISAIEKSVPQKYSQENIEAFNLGKTYAQ